MTPSASRLRRVALLLAVLSVTPAFAQVRASIEWQLGARVGASYGVPPVPSAPLAGSNLSVLVDAEARQGDVTLTLLARPGLRLDGEPIAAAQGQAGLQEAALAVSGAHLDVRVGVLRAPLETARLSVPFRVDGVTPLGDRHGLPGAEAAVYLDRVRVRAQGWWREDHAGGSLAVRLDRTRYQLEAHAVLDGTWTFGLGASGTAGDTVLYGEAWVLTDPVRVRGAAGASGYWGDALWTVEAAVAPPPGGPELEAYPQLLARLDVPLAEPNGAVALSGGAGWAPSVLHPGTHAFAAQAAALWSVGDPEMQLDLGPALQRDDAGTRVVLTLRLTAYQGF